MTRRRKLGCLFLFFLPFFGVGSVLVFAAVRDLLPALTPAALSDLIRVRSFDDFALWQGADGCASFLLFAVAAVVCLGVPTLVLRISMGATPPPQPPHDRVAPRPGSATLQSFPEPTVDMVGRLGATPIVVERWAEDEIRLRQSGDSAMPLLVALLGMSLTLFVILPSAEGGLSTDSLRLGLPHESLFLPSIWIATLMLFAFWPTRARVVTLTPSRDSVEVSHGRRRRVLGISRAQALETREVARQVHYNESGTPTATRYRRQLILWVVPASGQPAPYLLVETDRQKLARYETDCSATQPLVENLSTALRLPLERPEVAELPASAGKGRLDALFRHEDTVFI